MEKLSHEGALIALVVSAAAAWLLAGFFLAAHRASQPFGLKFGMASERGTAWGLLRNLTRLAMWCSLAGAALSLVLNVVRFAKG